jgi:hypothetical protein
VAENRELYCQQRGYELVVERFGAFSDRTAHWGPIRSIKKHLANCDWLFYLDTDLVVTNFNCCAEDYIDESFNCVIGRMPTAKHVSTSGFLLKNCAWSFELLERWWADPCVEWLSDSDTSRGGGLFWDQSGFHKLLDTCPEFMKSVKVLPCGSKAWNNENWSWSLGDWVFHTPGVDMRGKLRLLGEAVNNFRVVKT